MTVPELDVELASRNIQLLRERRAVTVGNAQHPTLDGVASRELVVGTIDLVLFNPMSRCGERIEGHYRRSSWQVNMPGEERVLGGEEPRSLVKRVPIAFFGAYAVE